MAFVLGDNKITLDDYYNVVINKQLVQLGQTAIDNITKSRDMVENLLEKGIPMRASNGPNSEH